MKRIACCALLVVLISSCSKENNQLTPTPIDTTPTSPTDTTHYLIFKFRFDSTQQRLNNLGLPSTIPAGNAAQSPVFNLMSAHYIELAPDSLTLLGHGDVLYRAAETTAGGSTAIVFDSAARAANGEVFFKIPLKDVAAGTYKWLRVSLAYQNYDVKYRIDTTVSGITVNQVNSGTVASFIGFNTYIKNYEIKSRQVTLNANRKQGYWGFETSYTIAGISRTDTITGQAPDGATTVVNPIHFSSPIPAGSCVVTGAFPSSKNLVVTGSETADVIVEVSLSTNKSFEWKEVVNNGVWDPTKGEQVVDMGIRGLKPSVQ